MSRPLVIFDLETTGTDIAKDRIVEFGFIKIFENGDKEEKVRKINPTISIPEEATEVHSISNEDVIDCPTFSQIANSLYESIKYCDIAGYNCKRFDIPLLIEEFLRCGIEWSLDGLNVLDSYEIEKELNPQTLSGVYSRYFGKEMENSHSALGDCNATLEILSKQRDVFTLNDTGHLTKKEISDYFFAKKKPYKFCSAFYEDEKGIVRFNIGKHKDKSVYDEPGFLNWMLKSSFPIHTKNIVKELIK